MKVEYRTDASRQYMVVKLSESDASSYGIKMLTENHIGGLMDHSHAMVDCENYLYIDYTGLVAFSDYVMIKPLSEGIVAALLLRLAKLIKGQREYLLSGDNIMLEPDRIFVSLGEGEFYFGAMPVSEGSLSSNMLKTSELLISRMPEKDIKGSKMVYDLYQYCVKGGLTADALLKIVFYSEKDDAQGAEDSVRDAAESVLSDSDPDGIYMDLAGFEDSRKEHKKKRKKVDIATLRDILTRDITFKKNKHALSESSGSDQLITGYVKEKRHFSKGDKGNMLNNILPYLIFENGEVKELDRMIYILGSGSKESDIVLKDPSVSRYHAKLIKKESSFEICDCGSRYGTFVNDQRLTPGDYRLVEDGDRLSLGNKSFVYRCVSKDKS